MAIYCLVIGYLLSTDVVLMVTTRKQEQERQSAPRIKRSVVLPDGRHIEIRSALKPTVNAPRTETPIDPARTERRVRYNSNHNEVRLYSPTALDFDDSDAEGDDSVSVVPSVKYRRNSINTASKYDVFVGIAAILAWMLASGKLIFINKSILVDKGFAFPFCLTAIDQGGSTLLAWLAGKTDLVSMRSTSPLAPHRRLRDIIPVVMAFAASLFFGNFAYLGLSVAYINILKALTPAVTLIITVILGIEKLSAWLLMATMLISWGTALATAAENGEGTFHWVAFASFSFSLVAEAFRVILIERLLQKRKPNMRNEANKTRPFNSLELMVHLGPLTTVVLAVCSLVFEQELWFTDKISNLLHLPNEFIASAVSSFLVNLFSYNALRKTSGTTFKVAGVVRNILVVWTAVSVGDKLTRRELVGYAVSLIGFIMFIAGRMQLKGRDIVNRKGVGCAEVQVQTRSRTRRT